MIGGLPSRKKKRSLRARAWIWVGTLIIGIIFFNLVTGGSLNRWLKGFGADNRFFGNVLMALAHGETSIAPAKYIFLFTGDGMGLTGRRVTAVYQKAAGGEALRMDSLPGQGFVTTENAYGNVSDAAAAATALACAARTAPGMVGKGTDGKDLENFLAFAKHGGRKLGVITDTGLEDPVPAGFFAHSASARDGETALRGALASGYDWYACAGLNPAELDGMPVAEAFRQNGYKVTECEPAKLADGFNPAAGDKNLIVSAIRPSLEDPASAGALAALVRKAAATLDDRNGFIIVVNCGRIAEACRRNDTRAMIAEIRALDEAVGAAQEFAAAGTHASETLIVVTGVRDAGGLCQVPPAAAGGSLKLLSAQSRCSSEFCKIHGDKDFDAVKKDITAFFGLKFPVGGADDNDPAVLSDAEENRLRSAYEYERTGENASEVYTDFGPRGEYHCPLAAAACRILGEHAGVRWCGMGDCGNPVPLSAGGIGEMLFCGKLDNNELCSLLKQRLFFSKF